MNMLVKKINVTQKHIQKSEKEECSMCPVALALKDAFKLDYAQTVPSVDEDKVALCESYEVTEGVYAPSWQEKVVMRDAPRSVERFVKKFDKTGKGKPFSFIFRGEVNSLDGIKV